MPTLIIFWQLILKTLEGIDKPAFVAETLSMFVTD